MSNTPITDLLEQMRDAGGTLDAAIPAVRLIEMSGNVPDMSGTNGISVPDREAIIREYERKRKGKSRKKSKLNKGGAKANDVAPRAANVPDKVPDARIASCDLSSSLKKETSEEEEKKGSKKEKTGDARARGTRLSPDAVLAETDRAFARNEGMTDAAIDRAWSEFVDFWIGVPGARGVKLNWSATWRNRVRAISPKGRKHETPNGVIAAADRLVERFNYFDEPAPGEIRGGEGPRPVRLLSSR